MFMLPRRQTLLNVPTFLTWLMRLLPDGSEESFVSSGYQVTIRPSDYGYDQHLIGLFTELADYHLLDREGNYITDRSGNQITCQTEREG